MKFLEIINKIKRRAGEIAFLLFGLWVIMNPTAFITLGGDAGYKLFTCVWALIIAHLAISQIDRHWSQADDNKDVSLSNFSRPKGKNLCGYYWGYCSYYLSNCH